MQEVEVKNTAVSQLNLESSRLAKSPKQMHFDYNGISVYINAIANRLNKLGLKEKPIASETRIHSRPINLCAEIKKGPLTNQYVEPLMTDRTGFRSSMNQREIRFATPEKSLRHK